MSNEERNQKFEEVREEPINIIHHHSDIQKIINLEYLIDHRNGNKMVEFIIRGCFRFMENSTIEVSLCTAIELIKCDLLKAGIIERMKGENT